MFLGPNQIILTYCGYVALISVCLELPLVEVKPLDPLTGCTCSTPGRWQHGT